MTESSRYPALFPPLFASAWGDDVFGLWADLQVSPSGNGSTVVQRMRWIEPGTFWMGAPDDEPEHGKDESPRHPVTLTHGFWLADTACTQEFWQTVKGSGRSHFRDNPENPVENVSWEQAQTFLARLRALFEIDTARLPSEAEWEYACRAGTDTPFFFGANITPEQVNYNGNHPYARAPKGLYRKKTVPVKALPPNAWGLFGMHGNVFEWCQDWFRPYSREPVIDPTGPDTGDRRVMRGGCFTYMARAARSSYRDCKEPDYHYRHIGFRLAISPSAEIRPPPPPPPPPKLPAPPRFEVIDLGELESSAGEHHTERRTTAVALNNNSQIVGRSNGRPFLWSDGRMLDLRVRGFVDVVALNDAGALLGYRVRTEAGGVQREPIVWDRKTVQVLGVPEWEDSVVAAINDDGNVVGAARVRQIEYQGAVRWLAGTLEELSVGGQYSGAVDVNSKGDLVGYVAGGGVTDAFVLREGRRFMLAAPGNAASFANGLNEFGEVVGWIQAEKWSEFRAALWKPNGVFEMLPLLEGLEGAQAEDINDSGQIVGTAHTRTDPSPSSSRAVLWDNRRAYDLNTLLLNKRGAAELIVAGAINNLGEIIANASDGRAYLLRPVPPRA